MNLSTSTSSTNQSTQTEISSCKPSEINKSSSPRSQSNSNSTPESTDISTVSLRSRSIVKRNFVPKSYNTIKLNEVAKIADRYNVSNRVAAAISTAALVDAGVINDQNINLVIDKNKVSRKRIKEREYQANNISFDGIKAIYFDGRKDDTISIKSNGGKKVAKEEHIAFVQQPNSFFIGHKAVKVGTAKAIKESIIELLTDKSIPINEIKAIGCDGTNTNTGHNGGVIRLLEVEWEKPMQWNVCMLHLNELPFRALLEKLDGAYTSKGTLSGPIGKKLNEVETFPVVAFEKIDFHCNILNDDSVSLSTDQKYLFDMCRGISSGNVSPNLANQSIGVLSRARWVTTASRNLRLYISEEEPSFILEILVKYIMFVYAPTIFKMKYRSSMAYGAVHLADMVKAIRFLPPIASTIVKESISHNAFFAHPEHIAVAKVNDDREDVRLEGWKSILNARSKVDDNVSIRKFKVPEVNFNCDDYLELTADDTIEADPPILKDIAINEENIEFLASKKILEHEFGVFIKNIPLHTQSVERTVKMVTESSKKVCGEKARDGFIANTILSRNSMPKFDSKKDYKITRSNKHLKV